MQERGRQEIRNSFKHPKGQFRRNSYEGNLFDDTACDSEVLDEVEAPRKAKYLPGATYIRDSVQNCSSSSPMNSGLVVFLTLWKTTLCSTQSKILAKSQDTLTWDPLVAASNVEFASSDETQLN